MADRRQCLSLRYAPAAAQRAIRYEAGRCRSRLTLGDCSEDHPDLAVLVGVGLWRATPSSVEQDGCSLHARGVLVTVAHDGGKRAHGLVCISPAQRPDVCRNSLRPLARHCYQKAALVSGRTKINDEPNSIAGLFQLPVLRGSLLRYAKAEADHCRPLRLQKVQDETAQVVGHPIQFYGLDGTARRNQVIGRNLIMHPRIAVMKALNRHGTKAPSEPRRKPAKVFRIVR